MPKFRTSARILPAAVALALGVPAGIAPACIAHAAPVEVTRFHTPETLARLDRTALSVVDAPEGTGGTLEREVWRKAVEAALIQAGFPAATDATSWTAEVRVQRHVWKPERERTGVSVGVGGSTGGYHGGGVGLGIGINLGGGSRELAETTLSVTIRDSSSGQSLWEGRAVQTVKSGSKDDRTDRLSKRLADALFSGFPGQSGETIRVK